MDWRTVFRYSSASDCAGLRLAVEAVLWIGCEAGSTAFRSCCTVDWLQGWQHCLH